MGITYGAAAGTHITSHAMAETLASQADQTGNNTVIVSDSFTNTNNGQCGDGTNGIGLSYVGRLLVISKAGTVQIRRCIAEVATGTGTTYRLTVHEDWDTNPVVTTDTIDVPYELADIEDGTASGGIGFTARTGFFTLTNDLIIDSSAGLQMLDGTATEVDDSGSSATFFNASGGYFYSGYEAGGNYINGGLMLAINNVTAEPFLEFQAGCFGFVYDQLFWGQIADMLFTHANTAGVKFYGCKWLNTTNELILYDADITSCKAYGKGATTAIVRVDAGTICNGLILSNIDTLDSVADTATETIELSNVIFSGVTDLINVRNNKTWNLIDPVWDAITYTDFTWVGSTSNEINDRKSVDVVVQKADGTKLQNALVIVHEETQLGDLVLELVTDANGIAEDSFIYKKHATNSVTTTYGGHAFRVDIWDYFPFASTQSSNEKREGSIVLSLDPNIVASTQSGALTDGSGITWNEDTNPSEIFDFTSGSGTLVDGMIITFTSGAVGTITGLQDGDSTAGTIHLKDRNITLIANGDTFSRTGGTAGTFSGTYTNDSKQPFTIWIDGADKSMQVEHDYLSALTSETTLSASGELIHEWGRDSQTRALYKGGSGFYTERSYGKGVFITNFGAGAIAYFTDDAGNTWVPPVSISVTFATMKDNSEVRVYLTGTNIEIAGIEDATTGTEDNRSFTWSSDASTVVDYVIHCFQPNDEIYQSIRVEGYTVPASNTTINIQQQLDRNAEN